LKRAILHPSVKRYIPRELEKIFTNQCQFYDHQEVKSCRKDCDNEIYRVPYIKNDYLEDIACYNIKNLELTIPKKPKLELTEDPLPKCQAQAR
jgi:hypothetical protein